MALQQERLLDPAEVQDPYPLYDEMRRTSPVWRVSDAPIFAVSTFGLLAEAARRHEDFSSHLPKMLYRRGDNLLDTIDVDVGPPTLGIADPPRHTAQKQMIFPRFVSQKMQLLEDELTAFTRTRLAAARAKGRFDFMEDIGGAVPIHAIAGLIGFRDVDERVLLQTAYDSSDIVGGTKTLAEMATNQLRVDEINLWLESLLAERDGQGSDDLLDAVKAAILTGQLSHGEGLVAMITLLSAGGESTSSLLGNAARILAERPAMQQRLKAEPHLLPMFIEEAARFESPFRHHLRSVPRDTELGGVAIPAGSTMMLMWGSANRDPEKFENPNELTLERKQQHVTFGRGIHLCVGAALARMEARIVLGEMLAQDTFPELDQEGSPVWHYNIMVRRHNRLPMVWQ